MKTRCYRAWIAALICSMGTSLALALDSVSAMAPRSLVILQQDSTVNARWTTMLQQGIDVKDSAATVVAATGVPIFPMPTIDPTSDRKAMFEQLDAHIRAHAPSYGASVAAILLAKSVSVGTAEVIQNYAHPLHGAKRIVWNLMIFSSGKYSFNSPTILDAGAPESRKQLQAIYVPLATGGRVPAEYRWDVFSATNPLNIGSAGNPSLPGGVLYWRLTKWDQSWTGPWSMVNLLGQFDEEFTSNGSYESTLMAYCLIDNTFVSPTGRVCPARNVPVSVPATTWSTGVNTPAITSFTDLRTFMAQLDASNAVMDFWNRIKPVFASAPARGPTAQEAKVWVNVTSRTLEYVCVAGSPQLAPSNNYTETGNYRYVLDRTLTKFMFDGSPESHGLINFAMTEVDTNTAYGMIPYSRTVTVTAADVPGLQANSKVLTHMAIWRNADRFAPGALTFGPAVVKNIPPCTAPSSCTPQTECSDECAPPSTANAGIAYRRTYCADFATPTWGAWNQMTGTRSCFSGSTRIYYNASCTLNNATCGGTQTATEACPVGQSGLITNTRTQECPSGIWGPWTQVSNTCSSGCTPQTENRSVACADGFSGFRVQSRQLTCPSNTWGPWTDTGENTCVPVTDVCPNLPGAQPEVPTGMFRVLVNGAYVCQPTAVLGTLCVCGDGEQIVGITNTGTRRTIRWWCDDPGMGRVYSESVYETTAREFVSSISNPGIPPKRALCSAVSSTTWTDLLR